MTRPSRLGLYADLVPVLDAMLDAGGGTYTLATPGDAVHWRQRVYKFRLQYQKEIGPSRYDTLVLRRPRGNEVDVDIRRPAGLFTPRPGPSPYDDEAFAISRKLLGDD